MHLLTLKNSFFGYGGGGRWRRRRRRRRRRIFEDEPPKTAEYFPFDEEKEEKNHVEEGWRWLSASRGRVCKVLLRLVRCSAGMLAQATVTSASWLTR